MPSIRKMARSGLSAALSIALVGGAGAALFAATAAARQVATARRAAAAVQPIGIVSPMGMEQAPILAAMHVTSVAVRDGYRFYVGTLDGAPVVNVRSGEKEYAAQMATTLLDLDFHVRADLLVGTAGAQSPYVHVGDVVLGGLVVDKSTIHYYGGGYVNAYHGVEMHRTRRSLTAGAIVGKYGSPPPTPATAAAFGYGPSTPDPNFVYVEALAGSKPLADVGLRARSLLGATAESTLTGTAGAHGSAPDRVVLGVIGSANQWTEPLAWQKAQHALYESDAGDNEGMGFAYANAQLGVPYMIVRGISDSPWNPKAYDGTLAASQAARVASYIVGHLPTREDLRTPVRLSMLWAHSNARVNGYLVASRVYYQVGPVTEVQYIGRNGRTVTVRHPMKAEYAPKAAN